MERNQLLNLVASILGFAAIGLPANMVVSESGNTYLVWMITAYFSSKSSEDGLRFIFSSGDNPEFQAMGIPFYLSFGLMAAGAVLLLLTSLPNSKLKMPVAWLPAVITIAGIASYLVAGSTIDIEGVLLEMFPIPIGMCAGIGAAVLSILPLVPPRK